MTTDGIGTTRWFGQSWGAPVCNPAAHVPTPSGQACALDCGRPITPSDQGVTIPHVSGGPDRPAVVIRPYHLDCWLTTVFP